MKNIKYLLSALVIAVTSMSAHATTAPVQLSEPSMFALAAAGAVAGLLMWRSRRKP